MREDRTMVVVGEERGERGDEVCRFRREVGGVVVTI
jgi:hypothetical protein